MIDKFLKSVESNSFEVTICVVFFFVAILYVSNAYFKEKKGKANRNIIESASGLFPTVGILCTFLGIIIGFSKFNINEADKSIDNLINGLFIAFIFSATGVLLSIIFQYFGNKNTWKNKQQVEAEAKQKHNEEREELLSLFREMIQQNKTNLQNHQYINKEGAVAYPRNFYQDTLQSNDLLISTLVNLQNSILQSITDFQIANNEATQRLIDQQNTLQNAIVNSVNNLGGKLIASINKFTYTDDNGNTVLPGDSLRQITGFNQTQAKAMSAFSTDLSDSISEVLSTKIKDDINPGFQNMVGAIQKLGTNFENPVGDALNTMVGDLSATMKTMLSEFKNSVTGDTTKNMEDLANKLAAAGNTLTDFPNQINSLNTQMESSFGRLEIIMNNLQENIANQSNASIENLKNQMEVINSSLSENIGKLQENQKGLLDTQTSTVSESQSLVESFKETIEKVQKINENLNSTISSYNDVKENLNSSTVNLKEASDNIKSTSDNWSKSNKEYITVANEIIKNNTESLSKFDNAFSSAINSSKEISGNFGTINEGLDQIFRQIETGLNTYSTSITSHMDDYFGRYTSALNNVIEKIATIAADNQDMLEDIQKLKK